MEQLISEIEAYCAARGITPQRLLKEAVAAQWGMWQRWKDGESSPTMKVADRIRLHMAENPIVPQSAAPLSHPAGASQ